MEMSKTDDFVGNRKDAKGLNDKGIFLDAKILSPIKLYTGLYSHECRELFTYCYSFTT